jgi:hypothetical protein
MFAQWFSYPNLKESEGTIKRDSGGRRSEGVNLIKGSMQNTGTVEHLGIASNSNQHVIKRFETLPQLGKATEVQICKRA